MLREDDSGALMTRETYQTTWRWGSRGCRNWGQSIDTTKIVNLVFACGVVFMGFASLNSLALFKMCGKKTMFRQAVPWALMSHGI